MICFKQDLSSPRRSGVQPAALSEGSKILIAGFLISNTDEPKWTTKVCGLVHLYKKQKSVVGPFFGFCLLLFFNNKYSYFCGLNFTKHVEIG